MKSNSALQILLLACVATTGYFISTDTIPPSGSNVAGFENEENITVYCEVFEVNAANVSVQQITRWHLEVEGNPSSLTNINPPFERPQFPITGDPVPDSGDLIYATNITIASLTADLDRMLLYCGIFGNARAATFTLRIYRPPNLQDLPEQIVVEGDSLTADLVNELMPEAFPFPQSVQWYKDGEAAENDTDRTLGYPNAVFGQVDRDDGGMYTLTATNRRLDDNCIEVGTDSASFNLTVIFGPQFDENVESPSDAAVLQNGSVTLVCGENLAGFPNPDIKWRDNNGALVLTGDRYTFSNGPEVVSLTINDTMTNDAGNWSCNVTVNGPNGESTGLQLERIIELVIVVPPSVPFQVTADPANIGPTFIHICWQQGSDMGTPPLSFFHILVQPSNMYYTTNGTYFNVTGLLPGTEYEFIVTAVSVSGDVEGESEPSHPRIITTIVTVPAPMCDLAPVSEGGVITVSWTYAHTGGLNLTQVQVQYKEPTQDQYEGAETLGGLNETSVPFTGLEAGSTYLFEITAYNAYGSASVTCPPVIHEIGVPRATEIRNVATPSPSVVVLTVLTTEAGIGPNSPFTFDVNATIEGGDPTTYPFTFNDYSDNTERDLTIDTLESGTYLFSVRSRNVFGASMFTDFEDLVHVEEQSDLEVLLFQLVLTGVKDCAQWVQLNVPDKLKDVTTSVQENVNQLCMCGFTTDDITNNAFECSETDADIVSFRARLHSVNMLEYIEQWREEGPAINIQGLILRVSADSNCPVVINSFTNPLCEPTQISTSSSGDDNTSTAATTGGAVAGVVVLVCVAVVIIIAIIVAHRRIHHGPKSFSIRKSAPPLEMSAGEIEEDTIYENMDQEPPTMGHKTGVPATHNIAYDTV